MATMDPGQRGFGRPMRRQGSAGGRAQDRNPESVLDRGLIEQLLAGEMLNTSATGGTRIRTREDAAAAEQRSADAGKIAAMVLAMLIGGAGASRSGAAFTGRLGDRAGFQHGGLGTGMRSVGGALNPRSADYLGPDAWMARSAQQPWGYTIGGNMVPPVVARVPASRGWLGPAAAAGGIQAARQGGGAGPPSGRPPMGGGRPPVIKIEDLVRAISGQGGGRRRPPQANMAVPQAPR